MTTYFEPKLNLFSGVSEFSKQSGKSDTFLKLEARPTPYKVRISPPFSELGLPYSMVKSHAMLTSVDSTGKQITISPVCFDYLFDLETQADIVKEMKVAISKKALADGVITKEDWQLYKQNCSSPNVNDGCPACKLARKLQNKYNKKLDSDNGAMNKLFPQFRAFFNVLYLEDTTREKAPVKVWGVSQTIFNTVIDKYNNYQIDEIDLFSPVNGIDALIKVEGKDQAKRYKLDFGLKQTPYGNTNELHDLIDIAVMGVKSYKTLVHSLKSTQSICMIADKYSIEME